MSLPTQDVLVQNLTRETQDMVHRAIREQLLPFARRAYPHLNAAFDKQPYPRPGNLFIIRYSASSARPGGRGLKMHKDETALTFNLCLSPQVCERGRARTRTRTGTRTTHAHARTLHTRDLASFSPPGAHPSHAHNPPPPPFLASALSQDGFEGGGTYFPAASGDVDGILLRPTPGYCLVHDGNIKHAGNEVTSGDRYILVGFYNADGRDRAGEEVFFNKKALEEERQRLIRSPPPPTQTIYFTTAVAAARGGASGAAVSSTQHLLLPPEGDSSADNCLRPLDVLPTPPTQIGHEHGIPTGAALDQVPPGALPMAGRGCGGCSSSMYDAAVSSSADVRSRMGSGTCHHDGRHQGESRGRSSDALTASCFFFWRASRGKE